MHYQNKEKETNLLLLFLRLMKCWNRTLRLLHFSCWCLRREIKENVSGKWKLDFMRTDYSIKTRTHCREILIIWEIQLYWYVFSVELT